MEKYEDVWIPIIGWEGYYEINLIRGIRGLRTGKILKINKKCYFELKVMNEKRKTFSLKTLLKINYPNIDANVLPPFLDSHKSEEEYLNSLDWRPLKNFDKIYEINIEKGIRKIATKNILKPCAAFNTYVLFKSSYDKSEFKTYEVFEENFSKEELSKSLFYQSLPKGFNTSSLENEVWKEIPNTYGLLFISNKGRAKRKTKRGVSINGRPTHYREQILKLHPVGQGYVNLTAFYETEGGKININTRLHRLVALAFIPNTENKPFINHIDGNKLNNSVENLEWCTQQENVDHALKIGLIKTGKESNNGRKLTQADVDFIRCNFIPFENNTWLWKKYKISPTHLKNIVKNKKWKI